MSKRFFWFRRAAIGALLVLAVQTASAQSLTLEQILTRMDEVGRTLRSLSASIQQKKWTDVLQEFDTGESGKLYFLKDKDKVYLRRDILKPQQTSLVIREGSVLFYQPRIKQLQKYQLGGNRDKAEFLLLGFGTDKEALKEAYQIRLLGEDQVDSRRTYRLELTPKSEKVSAFFTRIELWIDAQRWIPIQQKLVEITEDYMLIRFEQTQLNPPLNRSRFDLNPPKDVQVISN